MLEMQNTWGNFYQLPKMQAIGKLKREVTWGQNTPKLAVPTTLQSNGPSVEKQVICHQDAPNIQAQPNSMEVRDLMTQPDVPFGASSTSSVGLPPPRPNTDLTVASSVSHPSKAAKFSPCVENFPGGGVDPLVAVTALKRLWKPLLVNGSTVRALVDTGSTLSYFGEKASKLVADHLVPPKINMRVANGQITQTDGIVDTQMTVDGLTRDLRINVLAALDYEAV